MTRPVRVWVGAGAAVRGAVPIEIEGVVSFLLALMVCRASARWIPKTREMALGPLVLARPRAEIWLAELPPKPPRPAPWPLP